MAGSLLRSLVCCVMLIAAGGCDNHHKESSAVVPVVPASEPKPGQPPAVAAVQGPAGRFSVALLPAAPRAADSLLADVVGRSGSITFRWEKNGIHLDGEISNRLPAGNFARGDTVKVVVTTASGEATSSVTIENSPPSVREISFKNPSIHRGVDIELQPVGEDPDGDTVGFAFRWYRNGEEMSMQEGAVLGGGEFVKGDRIAFEVTPFDDAGPGEPYRAREIVIPNAPPRFVTTPPATFTSTVYVYNARAEDADGDALAYLVESAPPRMTMNQAGRIEWNLNEVEPGTYPVSIVAQDEDGLKAYQEYTLTISPGN